MTKLAPEWVQTSDPVIRSPARYHRTTAPASKIMKTAMIYIYSRYIAIVVQCQIDLSRPGTIVFKLYKYQTLRILKSVTTVTLTKSLLQIFSYDLKIVCHILSNFQIVY